MSFFPPSFRELAEPDAPATACIAKMRDDLHQLTFALELMSKKVNGPLTIEEDVAELTGMQMTVRDKLMSFECSLEASSRELNNVFLSVRVPDDAKIELLADMEWVLVARAAACPKEAFSPPKAGTVDYQLQQLFWSLYQQYPIEGLVLHDTSECVIDADLVCTLPLPSDPLSLFDVKTRVSQMRIVNRARTHLARYPKKVRG